MLNKLHKAICSSSAVIATCSDRLDIRPKMDLKDRLKAARSKRFEAANEAAAFLGIPQATYAHHEAGTRVPKTAAIERYARAFRVSPEWLQFGRGAENSGYPQPRRTVPLMGYVEAGGTLRLSDAQPPVDEVEAPDDATPMTVAVEIIGSSFGPEFAGWRAFYDDRRDPPTDDMIGALCIVECTAGRVMLKWMRRGRKPGCFDLHSRTEPPIEDVEIVWAAKVTNLKPKL